MRAWRPRFEREPVALFGAVVLHALGVWMIRGHERLREREPSASLPAAKDAMEIGIESASFDEPPEPPPGPPAQVRSRVTASVSHAHASAAPSESIPTLAEAEPALPEAEPVQEGSAHGPIDLGLGEDGWKRWVAGPNEGLPTPTEPARVARRPLARAPIASTTGGLREGLEARDRTLGLGPSGRVVTALREAAHGADAPHLGKARFQVTLTRDGGVEVSLKSATDPAEGWQKLALRAAAELRRRPPRIPSGRSGARWVVDLLADQRFPNGVDPKSLHAPRPEVVAPRLRSVEEGKKEIEELNPAIAPDSLPTKVPLQESLANTELPGLFLSGKSKHGSYRLGVTPLGTLQAPPGNRARDPGLDLRLQGTWDPSNIDAKAQRVVRVTVVDEELFGE